MDFFGAQDRARRATRWLVILFGIAILIIIQLINLLVMVMLFLYKLKVEPEFPHSFPEYFNWEQYFIISVVVVGFSLFFAYRGMRNLFGGGRIVAEQVGGDLIAHASVNPQERLLSQIVTEIAIAAGAPVPQVFLLNESGINSFAAGWDSTDAVICVSSGALHHLDRDELQAMIAHEFRHILSGDMRLNQIMAGLLQGLFIVKDWSGSLLGRLNRVSSRGSGALIYLGILGFFILGSLGHFLGRWIKSLLTKQQEFQADAAAVQFTRDPEAVIRMLQKFGVKYINSSLHGPRYDQFDHAFVGIPGKRKFLSSHPSVEKRILRINPNWEIVYPAIDTAEKERGKPPKVEKEEVKRAMVWSMVGLGVAETILESSSRAVSEPEVFDPEAGFTLSEKLLAHTKDLAACQATILAFILSSDQKEESSRLKQLKPLIDANIFQSMVEYMPLLGVLDPRKRIPLIEACIPVLKEMNRVNYLDFKKSVLVLFNTDFKLDHDEFIIHQLVISRLDRYFGITRRPQKIFNLMGDVKPEYELVLSLIAYTEHPDNEARQAFEAGRQIISAFSLKIIPRQKINLKQVNHALDKLYALTPSLRKRLLKASAATIALDGKITMQGYELLRTIAIGLEIPMPAIFPIPDGASPKGYKIDAG